MNRTIIACICCLYSISGTAKEVICPQTMGSFISENKTCASATCLQSLAYLGARKLKCVNEVTLLNRTVSSEKLCGEGAPFIRSQKSDILLVWEYLRKQRREWGSGTWFMLGIATKSTHGEAILAELDQAMGKIDALPDKCGSKQILATKLLRIAGEVPGALAIAVRIIANGVEKNTLGAAEAAEALVRILQAAAERK